jgi:hypothetical protein
MCGHYCQADVTAAGFPVASWALALELGDEPLCGRFPQHVLQLVILSLYQDGSRLDPPLVN